MYNQLESSDNHSMTSGRFWKWIMLLVNFLLIVDWVTVRKKQVNVFGITAADINTFYTKVIPPLKYLSNFWRLFNLSLINWEVQLHLSRSKDCVISKILKNTDVPANPSANPPTQHHSAGSTTETTFQITSSSF